MTALLIVVVVVVILVIYVIAAYNGLVRSKNTVDERWSDIDVQLKRRHDLIPNLVETVKGYAAHEKSVFEEVTRARAAAISAQGQGPAASGAAEGQLSGALGRLFAVAEAYPDLKAQASFGQLQGELTSTEDQISNSRRGYNGAVQSYNTKTQTFPTVFFARMLGFAKRDYFELDAPADREPVQVSFGADDPRSGPPQGGWR